MHGCGGAAPETGTPPDVSAAPVSSAANNAPTIQNAGDEYARVGENYVFQPAATDADGDTLSFTASNLPPWASIDPNDGRISGTPGPGDEGVYESIVIAVADAGRRAETAPFSITVVGDVATGVATLRWEAPPSKLDGSPLDDLAGYRILYGRKADDLDQSVLINDPAVTSYEFTSLAKGVWYFAVVAVNSGGLEGPPTVVTTKSI
jgi:hypothetical protein